MRIRRRIAFTLIELLVVIGIITVLIAILLPVLASVRQQSATLKCLANLRTCGQAIEMYIDEHKGYVPYPLATMNSISCEQTLWFTAIDPYLTSIANGTRSGVAGDRAYSEYKQCPLINNLFNLANGSSDSGTGAQTDPENTKSYKMNSCLRHYNPTGVGAFQQARILQVPNSSNFVLLGDGISMDLTGGVGSQTQSSAFDMDVNGKTLGVASCPYVRHRGACNILFVDGHAQSIAMATETRPLTGTPATPVTTWQSEYLDSSGNEVWMKQTVPPSTTVTIAGRNPAMTLQWSEIPYLNR